ncbi:MAG: DUF1501 domain-containing protein, partial [Pirellulales bacterium]
MSHDQPRRTAPCPGPLGGRRGFLRFGLAATGSLALPAVLRLRAEHPLPGGRRTAVIMVWLPGGCSHI